MKTLRLACLVAAIGTTLAAHAADHLDTPTVIADPAADIGDLFAWTSADGKRLNLVMDVVGRQFSDQVQYVFHVDSGKRFGTTTVSTTILCRFDVANAVECWAGDVDEARGDASRPEGLESRHKRLRVFAGLRDDPYFNNVRGTRAALNAAADAIQKGKAQKDAAGGFAFDAETMAQVFAQWRQTQGEPAKNFLAGWKTSALVVSVDLGVVNQGGPLLAVWGRTYQQRPAPGRPALGKPIDRMGRALTGNALLHTIGTADDANAMKEDYNRAAPADWQTFAPEIGRNLALYDSFDGVLGNQWLAVRGDGTPARYQPLARLLADDRLWVDSRVTTCTRYLAVEMTAERAAEGAPGTDCGGRTPNYNVNGVFRSLLIRGTPDTVDDGVDHDDKSHSTTVFPFLSATTDGKIAIANLDQLIEQGAGDAGVDELLLLRSKTLADYAALDRVATLAEAQPGTADGLLRRARSRAAVHRFNEALADAEAAARAGADGRAIAAQRTSILVAIGRADEALATLESNVARRPGFASHSALATAYAAVGLLDEADHLYATALAELDTTSPFPHAWIWFMRGLMWSEQGDDPHRGEAMYSQAVRHLPQFVVANIHLAELEVRRGDASAAMARLEPIAAASHEPEALALLGQLHTRAGQRERGTREIEQARMRFEALLARHPLAFADHAAEFYLNAGENPQRAWELAQQNLAARPTRRAWQLALHASQALSQSPSATYSPPHEAGSTSSTDSEKVQTWPWGSATVN